MAPVAAMASLSTAALSGETRRGFPVAFDKNKPEMIRTLQVTAKVSQRHFGCVINLLMGF